MGPSKANIYVPTWVCNGKQKMLIPLFLLGLAGECFAKIYEDISDLPGLDYDFVIVGGTPRLFTRTRRCEY